MEEQQNGWSHSGPGLSERLTGGACRGTLAAYGCEERVPDAAQPAVEVALPGGQLVDGGNQSGHLLVCQHSAALPAAAHAADVAHLRTKQEGK